MICRCYHYISIKEFKNGAKIFQMFYDFFGIWDKVGIEISNVDIINES